MKTYSVVFADTENFFGHGVIEDTRAVLWTEKNCGFIIQKNLSLEDAFKLAEEKGDSNGWIEEI